MNDFQKVLVVESAPRNPDQALSAELAELGLASVTTPFEATHEVLASIPAPSAILFQLPKNRSSADYGPFLALAKKLSGETQTSGIPVIIVGDHESDDDHDYTETLNGTVVSIANLAPVLEKKFALASRLRSMETELERRLKTLSDLEGKAPVRAHQHRSAIKLLAVSSQNLQKKLEPVLALSGITLSVCAAQTLCLNIEAYEPDVVLVEEMPGSAQTIRRLLADLRRDSRFVTLPILTAMEWDGRTSDPLVEKIDPAIDMKDIGEKVLLRGREHRYRKDLATQLRTMNRHQAFDSELGLFSPDFFHRHVQHVVSDMLALQDAASIAVLRLVPLQADAKPSLEVRRAFASLLNSLLRPDDLSTELSEGVFALLFTSCNIKAARAPVTRLSGILRHTALEGSYPGQFEIVTSIAELTLEDDAQSLIQRALHSGLS
jgi:hypothetical protein